MGLSGEMAGIHVIFEDYSFIVINFFIFGLLSLLEDWHQTQYNEASS